MERFGKKPSVEVLSGALRASEKPKLKIVVGGALVTEITFNSGWKKPKAERVKPRKRSSCYPIDHEPRACGSKNCKILRIKRLKLQGQTSSHITKEAD